MIRLEGFSDKRGRFTIGKKPVRKERWFLFLRQYRIYIVLLLLLMLMWSFDGLLDPFEGTKARATHDDLDDLPSSVLSSRRSSLGRRGDNLSDSTVVWVRPFLSLSKDGTSLVRARFSGHNDKGSSGPSSSELTGSFVFEGSDACSRLPISSKEVRSRRNARHDAACRIHFPSTITKSQSSFATKSDVGAPGDSKNQDQEHCLVTMKGDKSADQTDEPNQDRALLLSPIQFGSEGYSPNHQQQHPVKERWLGWFGGGNSADAGTGDKDWLLSIFDGHGRYGHNSAEVALLDLPFRIVQYMPPLPEETDQDSVKAYYEKVKEYLTESFLNVDAADGTLRRIPISGTTAAMALRHGHYLHVVTVGDSTVFLAAWNGTGATLLHSAVRHKPSDPVERTRIEASGGEVWFPPAEEEQLGESSRVIIRNGKFDTELALAMSRSLGDDDGKRTGVITAEPTLFHFDTRFHFLQTDSRERLFVVAATDGIIDRVSVETMATPLGDALFSSSNQLQQVCQDLIQDAAQQWEHLGRVNGFSYRDDITLAVAKIA